MSLSTIVALLQTTVMLLASTQGVSVSQSVREEPLQVARQTITVTETALPLSSAPHVLSTVGYTTQPSTSFAATPTSGSAPLTVTFGGTSKGSYAVNYGDGSLGPNVVCDGTCNNRQINLSHTYTSPGTYKATLTSDGTAVGTVTITVTNVN